MAFPTQWMQSWVLQPGSGYYAGDFSLWGTYMQWWTYDLPIIPGLFDLDVFANDFDSWFTGYATNMMFLPDYENSEISGKLYINTTLGPLYVPYDSPYLWTIDDTLPLTQSVVVRFFTGMYGRSYMGRKYFSGVSKSLVQGSYLTNAGIGLYYSNIVNNFPLSFMSQGVTFTAGMVSYKNAEFYPYTGFAVNGKLGQIKRRGRHQPTGYGVTVPKAPPP